MFLPFWYLSLKKLTPQKHILSHEKETIMLLRCWSNLNNSHWKWDKSGTRVQNVLAVLNKLIITTFLNWGRQGSNTTCLAVSMGKQKRQKCYVLLMQLTFSAALYLFISMNLRTAFSLHKVYLLNFRIFWTFLQSKKVDEEEKKLSTINVLQ